MKKRNKAIALLLGTVLSASALAGLAGCKRSQDTLVVMIEELNNVFNPFYSTAGTDMDVVGQTQISMLSTDAEGHITYGEKEATVVLDYKMESVKGGGDDGKDATQYTFVIKNGIKFSDGKPLTMNDVLFNMYVYLDPAYTGSTTMYSTDIVGLQTYRQQQKLSTDGEEDKLNETANGLASKRRDELINLFITEGRKPSGTYELNEADMKAAISNCIPTSGYMEATDTTGNVSAARTQLLADYQNLLDKFREELQNDFNSATEAFTEEPYKSAPIYYQNEQVATGFENKVTAFMMYEGYFDVDYPTTATGTDMTRIEKATANYGYRTITTEQAAIDYVYRDKVSKELNMILRHWQSGQQLYTEFIAKAKDIILHENLEDGKLAYPNIEGIVSLGHSTQENSVTIGSKTYAVAHDHNADGTTKSSEEYDVLRIRINGQDPKAIWNFGFTVAPHHYYSDPARYPVNIANNQFGVAWASFDFHTGVLQGTNSWGERKSSVPLGAGPYIATDSNNAEQPKASEFIRSNIVYYRANPNFILGEPKIPKLHYAVTSSSNALGALEDGSVHFIEPQYTYEISRLVTGDAYKSKGFNAITGIWNLGYGYIGINASYVTNIHLRRAIMAAFNPDHVTGYYSPGTSTTIAWPMSIVSWAYPRTDGGFNGKDPLQNMDTDNGHNYMMWNGEAAARRIIQEEMALAGVVDPKTDSRLTVKFTIAGASLSEHPAFGVFQQAREILNSLGWKIEIAPDPNALTKLSSGSLAVWAAAWGSTIDPDMYQVYHKNSTATSVRAWGYDSILADRGTYGEENKILNLLSPLIDQGRQSMDEATRTEIYKRAMGYVLDLAVEYPLYQRQVLYVYNANVLKADSLPQVNSFNSPLSKIWELELA